MLVMHLLSLQNSGATTWLGFALLVFNHAYSQTKAEFVLNPRLQRNTRADLIWPVSPLLTCRPEKEEYTNKTRGEDYPLRDLPGQTVRCCVFALWYINKLTYLTLTLAARAEKNLPIL